MALLLVGCGPPCEDLAVDLCDECPEGDREECLVVLGATADQGMEDACEAEREIFDCERLHE